MHCTHIPSGSPDEGRLGPYRQADELLDRHGDGALGRLNRDAIGIDFGKRPSERLAVERPGLEPRSRSSQQ